MNLFISKTLPIIAIGASISSYSQSQTPAKHPNIVLILADDHASAAISAYGSSLIKTPNIDRIASNGTRFTNCLTVCSLSAPSRAAIITGKYNALNGVKRIGDVFDGAQQTFPKLLQNEGYQTALIGKWHLRSQPTGFDYYNIIFDQGNYFNSKFKNSLTPWVEGPAGSVVPGYFTEVVTDMSIDWLEHRDKDKPFCLLLHHKAPHGPYEYPKKYNSIFADIDLPVPKSFNEDLSSKNSFLANEECPFSKLKNIDISHFTEPLPKGLEVGTEEYKNWAYQKVFKGYFRLVAGLDENIGRLLNYLEKSGLDKNTIIIYVSDNGFFLGDHGLFNKMWMYEESLKVPLIIKIPEQMSKKKNIGKVSNEMVSVLDLAPTILDLAEVKIPKEMQGYSLKTILQGKKSDWLRNDHFYHYYNQFNVPEILGTRTEKFKLIKYIGKDSISEWEFYDLKNDPKEMNNQINNLEYSKTITYLKKKLHIEKNKFELF